MRFYSEAEENAVYGEFEENYSFLYGADWRKNELLEDQLEQDVRTEMNILDYFRSGEAAEQSGKVHARKNPTVGDIEDVIVEE